MAWATGTGLGRARTTRRHVPPVLVVCLVAAAWTRPVGAQGAAVSWAAPDGCPSRPAFEGRLLEYLGAPPAGETRVAVTITRDGAESLAAQIVVEHDGRSGTRLLRDADCPVLADAAAFAAAVLIDPAIAPDPAPRAPLAATAEAPADVGAASAGNARTTADGTGVDAATDRDRPPAPRPAGDEESAAEADRHASADVLVVRAEAVGALGLLPELAPGVGLAIGHDLSPRLRVELLGRWLPARPADDARVPGTAGEIGLAEVGYRACALYSDSSPELPLCVGGWVGSMFGRGGSALQDSRTDSVAWLALELAFGLRWPLAHWLALHAMLAPRLPILRPDFRIEGLGTLHRSAAVVLAGSAGLEVRLR